MLNKIILVTGLLVSNFIWAGSSCNEPYTNNNKINVSELKEMKRDLNNKLDFYEFEYYYTLTHNRIYAKSINIQIDNKTNKENKEMSLIAKKKVNEALQLINKKTDFIYERKKLMVNAHIDRINDLMKTKKKRISQK